MRDKIAHSLIGALITHRSDPAWSVSEAGVHLACSDDFVAVTCAELGEN